MRSIMRLALGAASVMVALGSETVGAAPSFTTEYSYYSVSGSNPTGIYASLLRHLQRVNGKKHHAFTSIRISSPRTVRTAKGCRVESLSVRFLIRMPRHSDEASLSANDRRLWRQFSSFVKRHEETHRAIWMACARSIAARVIQAQSCDQAARRVIEQTKAACRKKDAAFDAAEGRRLDNHPFMRAAVAPIYAPIRTRKKTALQAN
jgi:predicted secreted Zn-dependent protease